VATAPGRPPPRRRRTIRNVQLIAKEADAMTREYQAALKVIDASTGRRPPTRAPNCRSWTAVPRRSAPRSQRDPEARFLLDRLQRTIPARLELTQRIATLAT
jgi:hypothetical protein